MIRVWLLAWLLLALSALGASGQEPYWCDSCDEVRSQHSATCPERKRAPAPAKRPPPKPRPARALLRLASAALAAGERQDAIGLYREALAHEPDLVGAWVNLGSTLWREQRWDEAERAYEEAYARRPSERVAASLARLRLAQREAEQLRQRTTLWVRAEERFAARDGAAALQALGELRERNARVWHFMARVLSRSGQREEAAQAYREALALESDLSQRALLESEHERTLAELTRTRRRARRAQLKRRLAAHEDRSEFDAALALLERALPDEPQPRWLFERLGRLHLERRPLQGGARAEWALRRALRLDPKQTSAWTNLGVLYDRLGHEGRALTSYRRALELDPSLEEIDARARALDRARADQHRESTPKVGWLQAPSLLEGLSALPSLNLDSLRQELDSPRASITSEPERGIVLRFDPLGALEVRRQAIGPEDPTLAWLRDHGSPAVWPELEATLEPAPRLALEGPRGWSFGPRR